jgi:threonine/homoserine/homoserine lactone efflux protein
MTFEAWLVFMAFWIAVSIPLDPNALNGMASAAAAGFWRGLRSVADPFAAACLYITVAASGVVTFLEPIRNCLRSSAGRASLISRGWA